MAKPSPTRFCRNNICITLAFGFVFFSLFAGVFFCMLKNPRALAQDYAKLATIALSYGDVVGAKAAAEQSLKQNPTARQGWEVMAKILLESGDSRGAQKAARIANALGHPAGAPNLLYAMPAELRLSFLAMSDKDIR